MQFWACGRPRRDDKDPTQFLRDATLLSVGGGGMCEIALKEWFIFSVVFRDKLLQHELRPDGVSLLMQEGGMDGRSSIAAQLWSFKNKHSNPGGVRMWHGETRWLAYCDASQGWSCRSIAESQVRQIRGAQCYTGSDI